MTNEVNLGKWLNELRTTDIPQVTGTLVRVQRYGWDEAEGEPDPKDIVGMCCLGIGEHLMGGKINDMVRRTLPKYTFAEWLDVRGDDTGSSDGSASLYVAWPNTILPRGYYDEEFYDQSRPADVDVEYIEVAELNDTFKLTFAEIADVIEYFGLVE